MEDDEIELVNACTELVTNKAAELFPQRLLGDLRPGDWVGVKEFCTRIGLSAASPRDGVFATWLRDPRAMDGYVVVMFFDSESNWSMAAHYNRARLGIGTQSQAAQRAPIPTPFGAAPQSSAPAT